MIPLARIIHTHGIHILSYAEDTQLILSLSDKMPNTRTKFATCMTEVVDWMKANFLKLNPDKTEDVIFG